MLDLDIVIRLLMINDVQKRKCPNLTKQHCVEKAARALKSERLGFAVGITMHPFLKLSVPQFLQIQNGNKSSLLDMNMKLKGILETK